MRSLLSLVGVAAVLASGACDGSDEAVLGDADAEVVRTQAQVVLRYDAARKADLIDGHYFKAEDFTGTEIVVKSARTRIDIARLLPDRDITAPNELCQRGGLTGVKKIVEAMLANTDGNGDHWLQGGSKIESVANGALVVSFTTVGEGGPRDHVLDVARCR